jgi:hypothetical protein
MRAKVAELCNGHPFEQRFIDLDDTQLAVLYRLSMDYEFQKKKETHEMIEMINNAWVKNFKNLFDDLRFFVNPEMYNKINELTDMVKNREVINEDNFEQEWEKMLSQIPKAMTIEYESDSNETNVAGDIDIENYVAGFIPYHQKKKGGL